MASKRPRKHSALVASAIALLAWVQAPAILAANSPQLDRCYDELAILSEAPLLTLERYPAYLLQRLDGEAGEQPSAELDRCEAQLSALVAENRVLNPGLLNQLCSQSERIPRDYAHLQTYLRGMPSMQCESQWFDALTPGQWQQLQPQLARISNLEYDCIQALEALPKGGQLRERMARATQRLMGATRIVFTAQWRETLAGLPEAVASALTERERQLEDCERLLTNRLAAIYDE